jgi:hypothetical protein
MIQNDEQLKSTRDALNDLEASMAALNRRRGSVHPDRFALMAEPLLDHIRRLRAEIDEYIGLTAAVLAEAPLWLRLQGPGIELNYAPTSILTAMVDVLRVGVQAVAEFLHLGGVGARPTAALKEACDLRLVDLAPGSIQVGLRLPDLPPGLFPDADVQTKAKEALALYLRAANWAGSDRAIEQFESEIPNPEQRRIVLSQVARIVPRPRGGLEIVELSGRSVPQGVVRLRREVRDRIREAITRMVREEMTTAEGILREIDLDQRSFIIRDLESGRETRCAISAEASGLLEIAKASLDHRVTVVGVRRRDSTRRQVFPLEVREIEVVDEDTD